MTKDKRYEDITMNIGHTGITWGIPGDVEQAYRDTAELGYQLLPSARGQGVTRTAARMALAYAFAPVREGGLGLRRVIAQTSSENAASNRVLSSLGFTNWGIEPSADALPDGRTASALHWALDAADH